jgi:cytochrome c oxidase cbb3-type subunit III
VAATRAQVLRNSQFAIRCALATFAAFAIVGCDFPGKPNPADRPVTPEQIVAFKPLYQVNCSGCHGASGNLGPAPPLNDETFLAIIPDAELLHVINAGRAGTPMPAFAQKSGGPLTDAQVKSLVDGIKASWKSATPPDEPLPGYQLTKTDNPQSASGSRGRGAEVYARACAHCHGTSGEGGEHGGAINDPAFLALISDQALRRIVITGRPDLGMPTYAEPDGRSAEFQPLTSAEIDDLVALLADWRTGRSRAVSADKP